MVKKVKKRDGSVVLFDKNKIKEGLEKVVKKKLAFSLTENIVTNLEKKFGYTIPSVQEIEDTIEEVLMQNKLEKAASKFNQKRKKEKSLLSENALKVAQKRYLKKDEKGNVIETPDQMFRRVARAIAEVNKLYKEDVATSEEDFYQAMKNLEFLPNSPTLMNAGVSDQLGLSACYVLPIEDSLESIFDALKFQALIHQGGGGTGFSFSKLRPKGDIVNSSKGSASGPASFMKIFDAATQVIKQGGRRRGANMGVLRVDHPDIEEFIQLKQQEGVLENFNISVAITDKFMNAVLKNKEFELINPRTKQGAKKVKAKMLWQSIVKAAWKKGDPGLIFIDEINRMNKLPKLEIEATNPCGEQPLFAFESCTLGSINLTKMVNSQEIDYEKLKRTIQLGVKFLDNVIDANKLPIKEIEEVTKSNRKIGLGVMGWAEMLILMNVKYESKESLVLAEKLMKFIQEQAIVASQELAKSRGTFPNYKESTWKAQVRNATITTIAPTGTLSILANCSSGIEPLFAISFVREVMEGTRLKEVNPLFEEKKFKRELFMTAGKVSPQFHVKMQAVFQKYTDNAVSKTINLRKAASVKEVEKAFWLAYKLKCKGITVFREGSKEKQVLYQTECFGRECE